MKHHWWHKKPQLLPGSGTAPSAPLESALKDMPADEATPDRSPEEETAAIQAHPHHHRIEFLPGHLVDVSQASHRLLQELHCDDWFVASRNEHQCVVRLLRAGVPHYAVSFQCAPCVDKAIFHGSRAWSVSIIPLHGEDVLLPEALHRVKASLTAPKSAD
jgi:hypothetical protein